MFIAQLQSKACVIPAVAVLCVLEWQRVRLGEGRVLWPPSKPEAQVGGGIRVLSVRDPR